MPQATATLELSKVHGLLIGTQVRTIGPRELIGELTYTMLHAFWIRELVLAFPDQSTFDDAHIAFVRRFRELQLHRLLSTPLTAQQCTALNHSITKTLAKSCIG